MLPQGVHASEVKRSPHMARDSGRISSLRGKSVVLVRVLASTAVDTAVWSEQCVLLRLYLAIVLAISALDVCVKMIRYARWTPVELCQCAHSVVPPGRCGANAKAFRSLLRLGLK